MFGCGGNRDRTKRPRMGEAAAAYADFLVVTTDNPRFEEPEDIIADILPGIDQEKCPTEVIPDRRAAIRRAVDLAVRETRCSSWAKATRRIRRCAAYARTLTTARKLRHI